MGLEIKENVILSNYTSIGLGGAAQAFCKAGSSQEILQALQWAATKGIPVQILGGGSNIVFADSGFAGLVIQIVIKGRQYDSEIVAKTGKEEFVGIQVGAGENWDEFVLDACERGLSGIECLSGIPGTVGATPIQNVGAYGQEVASTIEKVVCLDLEKLKECQFSASQCEFEYRQSRFKQRDKKRYVILGVRFRLKTDGKISAVYPELRNYFKEAEIDLNENDPAQRLLAVRQAVLDLRYKKSMVLLADDPHSRSCGSFFMNPVLDKIALHQFEQTIVLNGFKEYPSFTSDFGTKIPAAWLIEKSGFVRGYRYKGVGVSPRHALALVNYHGTTAELLELRDLIQHAVWKKFSLKLQSEPLILTG